MNGKRAKAAAFGEWGHNLRTYIADSCHAQGSIRQTSSLISVDAINRDASPRGGRGRSTSAERRGKKERSCSTGSLASSASGILARGLRNLGPPPVRTISASVDYLSAYLTAQRQGQDDETALQSVAAASSEEVAIVRGYLVGSVENLFARKKKGRKGYDSDRIIALWDYCQHW